MYALINTYRVALPLHPEYRTMPMVWYIPPLSPVVDVVRDTGYDAEDRGNLFAAIEALRIPVDYLAQLFTAGDPAPVDAVLRRLAAMRSYMRDINLGRDADETHPGRGRHDRRADLRHVPAARASPSTTSATSSRRRTPSRRTRLEELATECSLDYEGGPGMGGSGPVRRVLRRADADRGGELPHAARPADRRHRRRPRRTSSSRVNLLNWDGKGRPAGLFPPRPDTEPRVDDRRRGPVMSRDAATHPLAWQAQSLLLAYPDERPARPARPAAPHRRRAAGRRSAHRWRRFLDHVAATPLGELAADYVATFDHRKRCCLFLTYYAHGDTRKRGMALLELKQTYAAAGLALTDDELPDHLCVVLEFAATGDPAAGRQLLARPPRRHRSCCAWRCATRTRPGRDVLDSVSATLPPLVGDERDAVARLAAQGPPEEQVGLAPFAPPEYMPTAAGSPPMTPTASPRATTRTARSTSCCGSSCPTSRSPSSSAGTSGATATTSSAGPPAPPSSTNGACCAWAARCSTSGSCSSSPATSAAC